MLEINTDDWQIAKILIETLPGVLEVQTYGESLHILVDSADTRLEEITSSLEEGGLSYSDARKAPARMEEAFISLINRLED